MFLNGAPDGICKTDSIEAPFSLLIVLSEVLHFAWQVLASVTDATGCQIDTN